MDLGLDWRPRIWSGGSSNAPEWRNKLTDDFGEKFRKDRDRARLDKQIEANRQELIGGSEGDLWENLRTTAHAEVDKINRSDSLLIFADSDIGQDIGFSIIYNREGEERRASAHFRRPSHTVEVKTVRPAKQGDSSTYRIGAQNNEARFELHNIPKTSQEIVKEMLSDLLKQMT
jgi:hypothetical protein